MDNPPQVTALRTLQEVFTTTQIQKIADACKQVAAHGWGSVILEFDNGKPDIVGVTVTTKLEKLTSK